MLTPSLCYRLTTWVHPAAPLQQKRPRPSPGKMCLPSLSNKSPDKIYTVATYRGQLKTLKRLSYRFVVTRVFTQNYSVWRKEKKKNRVMTNQWYWSLMKEVWAVFSASIWTFTLLFVLCQIDIQLLPVCYAVLGRKQTEKDTDPSFPGTLVPTSSPLNTRSYLSPFRVCLSVLRAKQASFLFWQFHLGMVLCLPRIWYAFFNSTYLSSVSKHCNLIVSDCLLWKPLENVKGLEWNPMNSSREPAKAERWCFRMQPWLIWWDQVGQWWPAVATAVCVVSWCLSVCHRRGWL